MMTCAVLYRGTLPECLMFCINSCTSVVVTVEMASSEHLPRPLAREIIPVTTVMDSEYCSTSCYPTVTLGAF